MFKLSLYTSPSLKSKYVEDPESQLEETISHLRHSLAPYAAWVQDCTGKAMPKLEKACEYVKESYEIIKAPPPGLYPRLGVIGFAGIVGLFLARGSKIKRLVYPISFMGIGIAVYYPQQTVALAKVTGLRLYDWSLQAYINLESLWKDSSKKKKSAKANNKESGVREPGSQQTVSCFFPLLFDKKWLRAQHHTSDDPRIKRKKIAIEEAAAANERTMWKHLKAKDK
ncbi:MICOS complex subunit MIC26 isoform X2 [Ahaetulla prasina]|uniref:MICOS complex subunit MIC26 isoform X2 n=1 Tax=Ahaetulla prasina TaxID=499056 RepID=UPI002649817D|nr:MICOS complex subunit MIC26 isoform X2 [Ahaetulla prasina]